VSRSWLCVGWGQKEKVDAASFRQLRRGKGSKPPFESPHGRYPELSETFVLNANAEPKEDGIALQFGPQPKLYDSIAFALALIYFFAFSAQKTHVKPPNNLTPSNKTK